MISRINEIGFNKPQVPPWTPASLGSTVKLWLDDTSHTGSDGTAIQTPTDLSGNANNPTQATSGNRPLRRTGANGKNGLAVLEFDAVDDFYNLTSAISLTHATIVAVGRYTVGFGGKYGIVGGGFGAPFLAFNGPTQVVLEADQAYGLVQWNSATAESNWGCLIATFNNTSKAANIYWNSTTAVASNTSMATSFLGNLTMLMKGSSGGAGGKLAGIIICDSVLGSTDISNMFTYQNSKWALF